MKRVRIFGTDKKNTLSTNAGQWVDPQDGKFYAYFHNETGWGADETSYNAYAHKEGEPDFRHIGLMASSDQGRTWDFKGWIITSHRPSWTNRYKPDGVGDGQHSDIVFLGAADHSLFVNSLDGFMYIFYGQIAYDLKANSVRRGLCLCGAGND